MRNCFFIKAIGVSMLSLALTGSCEEAADQQGATAPVVLQSLSEPCYDLVVDVVLARILSEYNVALNLPGRPRLTIRPKYQGGEIICHPPQKAPDGSRAPDLPARLEIEMQLDFVTDDRAFNEVFTTKISASGGETGVQLAHTILPDSIRGDFKPLLPDYENIKISFTATFSNDETWGAVLKSGNKPGRASEVIPVARWDSRR